MRFSFEMQETVEILMNAVNVNVKAYLVPTLALERFGGMDDLNRSYEGVAPFSGGAVVPFVETSAFGAHGANLVYKYLGLHANPATLVNTAYLEAYNAIFNFRAANRSPDITPRARLATDLAPAFWNHTQFRHIVPDFDQALIDGEVALNVVDAMLPLRGLGIEQGDTTNTYQNKTARESDGTSSVYPHSLDVGSSQRMQLRVTEDAATAYPDVWAELQQNGITVSLSNIELAKKTAAFARLRQQYAGHSDDYIINLLMDGISIPEQALNQPLLLAEKATIFGMSKRYASDAANLTESVVNGATFLDLSINVPPIATGGVIMVIAEVTPEQLFERQKDPFLHANGVEDFPQYLRDTLDPEKVSVVPNDYVDTSHTVPAGTFGYAPLNYEWNFNMPRVGGKFYRPAANTAFDEDRQRIWAVETVDPVLSQDFYLCTTMHTKPFKETVTDPFEVVGRGAVVINGNTVFGGALIEASNDYDTVLAEAPQERITKA